MRRFKPESELENIISQLKEIGYEVNEIIRRVGIDRGKFNNIRKLNNKINRDWLTNEIRRLFDEFKESDDKKESEEFNLFDYIKELQEENKRLKNQVDMFIKKLIDSK